MEDMLSVYSDMVEIARESCEYDKMSACVEVACSKAYMEATQTGKDATIAVDAVLEGTFSDLKEKFKRFIQQIIVAFKHAFRTFLEFCTKIGTNRKKFIEKYKPLLEKVDWSHTKEVKHHYFLVDQYGAMIETISYESAITKFANGSINPNSKAFKVDTVTQSATDIGNADKSGKSMNEIVVKLFANGLKLGNCTTMDEVKKEFTKKCFGEETTEKITKAMANSAMSVVERFDDDLNMYKKRVMKCEDVLTGFIKSTGGPVSVSAFKTVSMTIYQLMIIVRKALLSQFRESTMIVRTAVAGGGDYGGEKYDVGTGPKRLSAAQH